MTHEEQAVLTAAYAYCGLMREMDQSRSSAPYFDTDSDIARAQDRMRTLGGKLQSATFALQGAALALGARDE